MQTIDIPKAKQAVRQYTIVSSAAIDDPWKRPHIVRQTAGGVLHEGRRLLAEGVPCWLELNSPETGKPYARITYYPDTKTSELETWGMVPRAVIQWLLEIEEEALW